jgi:DNA-binding MarR family transcriptional regulator
VSDLRAAAAQLGGQVVRLNRQLAVFKAHAVNKSRHGVDPSAYVLLFHLAKHGEPLRASALADAMCSDPSTASRQIASLVELGLVERLPDPDDGRAVRIAATEAGTALFARMRDDRDQLFAAVVAEWDVDDVHHLVTLLDRFTTDLELHRPRLPLHTDSQENA